MKARRYFMAKNATYAISPLAELTMYCAFLTWHDNWEEITFEEWWPIHWQITDFTGECLPCPEETAFWDGDMAYSAGVKS